MTPQLIPNTNDHPWRNRYRRELCKLDLGLKQPLTSSELIEYVIKYYIEVSTLCQQVC